MNGKIFKRFFAAFFLLIISGNAVSAQKSPRVFLLNARILQENKAKLSDKKSGDELKSALAKLEKDAQKLLKTAVLPIIAKTAKPPSGDKHDYMSQAPYFWKNPNTKDGLPYIRRDGERNPEIRKFPDHELLDKMIESVETLSTAYYFTCKEEYAAKSAEILRLWFLDAKTKMNPNLEFAQAIPGQNTGRGIGIIETRNLPDVIDAIGLLENSKSWTSNDQTGIENWFSKYLDWLLTSKNGRDEAAAKNNHGTFYDVQTASFALFVGKKDLAKNILKTAAQKRIAKQVAPDGTQPLELDRTKSWDYSVMNLDGLISLAELGESVGVDLWHFETDDKRGVRPAIEFLFQFNRNEKNWKYKQIEPLKIEKLFPLMRRANHIYKDEKFTKMMNTIPNAPLGEIDNLFGS